MKKSYIKMNNNDEHLSIGNLFRIIKESSKNKTSALQSEIFCDLFQIEYINDTTVNNYCVGCRSIGSEYKQIFLNKIKRYENEREEFCDNIINLINILDGVIYKGINDKIAFINKNNSAINLAKKIYNIAKNDRQITNEFSSKLYKYLNEGNIYECLVEELIFIVIYKKQPLYETELKKEVLENLLNDTSISSIDLQEYLSLKLREGINYDYSMKKLADNGNAYANFEVGSNEYYGYVKGYPRYTYAYNYLKRAADLNHAGANYMLGNMYIQGLIGSKQKEELKKGYEYLEKSLNLGNVAALNTIGNMYKEGIYPLKKDLKKAKEYYKLASEKNYAYAFNNLGLLEELDNKNDKAFEYYLVSADLGESWACNKVGEYYRLGIIETNMEKAFYYYNKALESNHRVICNYAYYNLAKYFYMHGYLDIVLESDEEKAVKYLTIASENNIIKATIELFIYYIDKYQSNHDKDIYEEILRLKNKIETSTNYNEKLRLEIEEMMEKTVKKKEINLDLIN